MKRFTFLISLALASLAASAQVTVSEPWVRATVPQQKATGAFMKLQSTQDAKAKEIKNVKRIMKILRLSVGTQGQSI